MPDFRDQLLAAEPPDAARARQLEEEITNMWNQKLTKMQRVYWMLSLIAAALLAVPAGVVSAFYMPDGWMRAIWWLFTASNVAMAIFAWHVLRRGSFSLREGLSIGKIGSGLTFAIAMLLVVRAIANPNMEGIAFAIFGLLWFLLATSMNLWNRIIEAETKTREQFLQLELRLLEKSPPK
ncbi:MAG TPA: hypothetical protein VHM90_17740 [Phycisphaerae bacterium]|jgi:hypothetical protein|nr:hypothetical protein [Phycisphaerae bacterium]